MTICQLDTPSTTLNTRANTLQLMPGELTLEELITLDHRNTTLTLNARAWPAIEKANHCVNNLVAKKAVVYGINTGFGKLANHVIPPEQLSTLQHRLLLSHATGVGADLDDDIVALMLLLKINSLARGYSGVRPALINALIALYNHRVYPCVPSKGSVGASGDLAPLAHLSVLLIGVGHARHQGRRIDAHEALRIAGLTPLVLAPKEGLALINGTQASTAIALHHLFHAKKLFDVALVIGAMTVDAAGGADTPFDARIHDVRGHATQSFVAHRLRELLQDSQIRASHTACDKVQDPYSLRCQPQVMGACLAQIHYAENILSVEANAVSDNPLVFADEEAILSGGNFHAEPVAMAADSLALAIAEMGALSERRIALLIDNNLSGLPAFLVKHPGINSGFMIAHVTAASLASENKSLAHPASVDSLPTSANQEDHVSMATFAARRLGDMLENTRTILSIEALAAAQGIDFRRPHTSSTAIEKAHAIIRTHVAFYEEDRYFYPDIQVMQENLLTL